MAGGIIANYQPTKYEAVTNLYVSKEHVESNTGEYNFDGFYAQQVAEKYIDTVVGIAQTTEILKQSLEDSENISINELSNYLGSVSVQKTAPQIAEIVVTAENPDSADQLSKAIVESTIAKSQEYNFDDENGVVVSRLSEDSHIE